MIERLSTLPAWLVVVVIGASILVESGFLLGLVLPGTTAVIAMGVMAGLGVVPTPVAYVVAIAAAVAGPSIGWKIGHAGGPALRTSTLGQRIPDTTWASADRVIDARGPYAVAVAQFVVGARTLVPLLVGMSAGRYLTFAVVSIPAAAAWAGLLTTAGHLAGASYEVLTATLGNGTVAVAIIAVVIMALGWIGRLTARHMRWGLRRNATASGDTHADVDRAAAASVGERRAPRVTGALWWLFAVLAGTATSAVMVWAVRRSDLDALDHPVTEWIGANTPETIIDAAGIINAVLNAPNVLLAAYLVTFGFVMRHRSDADRIRRVHAVTVSLGLAALAVSSEWVASYLRSQPAGAGTATHHVDLQGAIVPCALAVAVTLASPWLSSRYRVVAWLTAAVLTVVSATAQLLTAAIFPSEVAATFVIAAAWTIWLTNAVRPGSEQPKPHSISASTIRPNSTRTSGDRRDTFS